MSTEELDNQLDADPGFTADRDSGDETGHDPAIEAEAREMGWVPESEWKGTPPKHGFASAEEFVRKGREVLPVVRSQLKRKEEELSRLSGEFEAHKRETADTLKRMERMTGVALQRQREQLEARFEERKEQAIEVGDKETYRAIVKEEKAAMAQLDEQVAEETHDKDDKKDPPKSPRAVEDWIAENDWFNRDAEMNAWAIGYHGKLLKEKPGLSLEENLKLVSARARKVFPDQFGAGGDDDGDEPETRTQRRGSPVEGGGRQFGGGGGNSRSLYAKLPADAKAQCAKFIEDGLYGAVDEKNLAKVREEYATEYFK